MKISYNPGKAEIAEIVTRPAYDSEELNNIVQRILHFVKTNGDEAIRHYSSEFDSLELEAIELGENELRESEISQDLKNAIDLAYNNIRTFHLSQKEDIRKIETMPGIDCWRKSLPIEKVGLYIPGGTAPLFSTVLMLGIPAQIAGSKEVILCTPPNKSGEINPAILYAAKLCGIKRIFKTGGAQAIAAMAYGTESIPQVYKIFGPGNQFVTKAKELAQMEGTAIDMPAGPSEVLVIADENAQAEFVAADLLSQAEHGTDSQVILTSNSKELIKSVNIELEKQLKELPRLEMAKAALDNSYAVYFDSMEQCLAFSNEYAPEHLIINTEDSEILAEQITNAGSVFLGQYSCESIGDYASGTNHTLPTGAFAKAYSGVSLDSFMKKVTFQKISRTGIRNIGPAVEKMAEAEGLMAHKNAVTFRLNKIQEDGLE